MSSLSQFVGGGTGGVQSSRFFPASTTFTTPAAGRYRIGVLGAGGSGGAIYQATNIGAASGGGGGGFVETESSLAAGVVRTLTVDSPAGGPRTFYRLRSVVE